MKFLFIFILSLSLEAFAVEDQHALSFADFTKLNAEDRADYIDSLRLAALQMEELQYKSGTAEASARPHMHPFFLQLLGEYAQAAAGDSCIYAGYVSQMDARNICQIPAESTSKLWSIDMNGQKKSQKLCTGSGQVLCNPLLFGFGPDGNGFCTTSTSRPTANCEEKYQAAPNYKAYHVADQLVSSGLQADFDAQKSKLTSYCSGSSSSAQSNICKTTLRKTSYMRAKISAAETRSKNSGTAQTGATEGGKTVPSVQAAPSGQDSATDPVAQTTDSDKTADDTAPARSASPVKETAATKGGGNDIYNSKDADLKRLRKDGILTKDLAEELVFKTEKFTDGKGNTWTVRTLESKDSPSEPVFFLPHDNEGTALETALRYIKEHGKGKIVFLDCGGQRTCGGVDPNRNFCDKKFSDKMFSYFTHGQPVIALHTNEDGCESHGGKGHISAKKAYSGAEGFYRGGDDDDLVVHNGKVPASGLNAALRSKLAGASYNEIYENSAGKNDCSMSFEATQRGRFYFNVESQERPYSGGSDNQFGMLNEILSWKLGSAAKTSSGSKKRPGVN